MAVVIELPEGKLLFVHPLFSTADIFLVFFVLDDDVIVGRWAARPSAVGHPALAPV